MTTVLMTTHIIRLWRYDDDDGDHDDDHDDDDAEHDDDDAKHDEEKEDGDSGGGDPSFFFHPI